MAVMEQVRDALGVSKESARVELARFFAIAEVAERAPEMFSAYIDAEWHRLLGTPEYEALCRETVGHRVGHRVDAGTGTPSWLGIYHERHGTLSPVWFADTEGAVDQSLYQRYLATRALLGGECPHPLIVAWDCTPTTNDEDEYSTHC